MAPRPAKRQMRSTTAQAASTALASSQRPDWEEGILKSKDWRLYYNLPAAGQLSIPKGQKLVSQVLRNVARSVAVLVQGIGKSDVAWPKVRHTVWTEEEKEKIGRVAVLISEQEDGVERFLDDQLNELVLQNLPKNPPPLSDTDSALARSAFEGEEIPDSAGVPPSLRLRQKIFEYVDEYYADRPHRVYHSPYAAIVSPSGSGKTFSVKHLAEDEDVWVIYTSLSSTTLSMPPAGPFAAHVRSLQCQEDAEAFWNQFLDVGLILVEVAKTKNFSPGMLFRVQYHSSYEDLQQKLAKLVMARLQLKGPLRATVLRVDVRKLLDSLNMADLEAWEASRSRRAPDPSLSAADEQLRDRLHVICIDEARGLLGSQPAPRQLRKEQDNDFPVAFRQFRRTLVNKSSHKTRKIMGLLLDTSSRVQNFSAASPYDTSLKVAMQLELFEPLYTLHTTWDALARQSSQIQLWLDCIIKPVTGADGKDGPFRLLWQGPSRTVEWTRFFLCLGRPLWGAFLSAGTRLAVDNDRMDDEAESRSATGSVESTESADTAVTSANRSVWGLIGSKLTLPTDAESQTSYYLALLLFRLQFYVADNKLSESFVASWMHYIRHISPDRFTIQTVQPGEPILAQYVAWLMKADASLCQNMVKTFVHCPHRGAVHAGDVGEMVAGLLMLFSMDAIRDWEAHEQHQSLRDFIVQFVGLSDPSAVQAPMQCTWDENARVHFTHICRLCTDEPLTQNLLLTAFLTGEAWFLSNNFPGADILVPVWQGPGKPMTALLVQVKNRTRLVRLSNGVQTQAWSSVHAARKSILALEMVGMEGCNDPLPVYGLYLNLRPTRDGEEPPPPSERLVFLDRDSHEPGNHTYVGIQLGFDEFAFPGLTHTMFGLLRGLLRDSVIGVYGNDKSGLAELIKTRNGFSFSS